MDSWDMALKLQSRDISCTLVFKGRQIKLSYLLASVNTAHCFIASLHNESSASRTFDTCWEVSQIYKPTSNICGVASPKIGELKVLILGRFSARQNYARYDYGEIGLRWHRIANVNKTITIKSLVSWDPKDFKLVLASRWADLNSNTSLIVVFSSFAYFLSSS